MPFLYCGKHDSYQQGPSESIECPICKTEKEEADLKRQVEIITDQLIPEIIKAFKACLNEARK